MASRYSSYKTRICRTIFQTWCITACEEYKNQSSPAVTNGSWKEQTIYLYLMQQWKLKWIHTAQQTHCILKPQPASAAGLTQIETAHQEGLLFATILLSCMCEWEGSCFSFALILFVKLSTVAVWNFSDQTNKHVSVHSFFVSFCDTKPLRQLSLTMFPYTRTTEGETPCSHWQKQSTLQPFCSVLMTGLWVLSWLSCPRG